ncbi:hypothetical protein OJ253_3237, partial [Cryptosporidium canis]
EILGELEPGLGAQSADHYKVSNDVGGQRRDEGQDEPDARNAAKGPGRRQSPAGRVEQKTNQQEGLCKERNKGAGDVRDRCKRKVSEQGLAERRHDPVSNEVQQYGHGRRQAAPALANYLQNGVQIGRRGVERSHQRRVPLGE